ncbi:hypothetical protein HDZ31DRAFT_68040 [Schizophyllum fasciatum]
MFIQVTNTPPPLKRATPKIGGSEGGFIALVVVLAVTIVVLCTAVFILLRDHSQSDEERRARRNRHHSPPASYDFKYRPAADMSATPSPSVLDRIRRLVHGRKRNQEATRMRGWVQAAGDEWDDDMSDLRHGGKDTGYSGTPRDTPFRPPKGSYATTTSESSVHIEDPETGTPPGLGEATPRSQSPQPMEGFTVSEESAPRRPHPSSRPFSTESAQSVQSMQSMRSLESGTRFIEGL